MLATETSKQILIVDISRQESSIGPQLLAQVWGDYGEVDERTVDVNVQNAAKILAEPG